MRAEKIQQVKDIGKLLEGAQFIFLISYKGLNVKDFSELRNNLAEHEVVCRVLKNRLITKAASECGIDALAELSLKGDTALVAGHGSAEPGAVAKAIMTFAKTHNVVSAKGGFLEGAILDADGVKSIAELPPREVLQAQLLGVLQAPARNLASVLYVKAAEIVNVLKNYEEKLAEAS